MNELIDLLTTELARRFVMDRRSMPARDMDLLFRLLKYRGEPVRAAIVLAEMQIRAAPHN